MQNVSNSVKQKVRRFSSKSAKGWDDAIKEAERQLLLVGNRATRLRKVIADFKELQASGHPYPCEPTRN